MTTSRTYIGWDILDDSLLNYSLVSVFLFNIAAMILNDLINVKKQNFLR